MSKKWDTLDLRDAFAKNLRVLQILGYWPPENSTPSMLRAYNIFGTLFIGSIFLLYLVTEIWNIVDNYNNLEKLIDGSFLLITHLTHLIKYYYFTIKNKRFIRMVNSLKNESFRARNERQYKILKRSIFKAVHLYNMFMLLAITTCMLWGIFPLIDASEHGKMKLPLTSKYPFSTEESPIFEIIFIYQIVATTLNAAANVSMDTTVSSLISVIGGELNILNDTLRNIKTFALERLEERGIEFELTETGNLEDHASIPPILEYEMNAVLVECAHQHWHILNVTNEIAECFNLCVLAQFAASSIVICVSMFQITLIDLFSIQFFSMLTYQGCMFLEVFIYCWFGNELILKSEDICTAVYSSDWYRNGLAYKKNMLMIMIRAQVPIQLYAGNLFGLSLGTFAAILRSSWSYFAVLRKVQSDAGEIAM